MGNKTHGARDAGAEQDVSLGALPALARGRTTKAARTSTRGKTMQYTTDVSAHAARIIDVNELLASRFGLAAPKLRVSHKSYPFYIGWNHGIYLRPTSDVETLLHEFAHYLTHMRVVSEPGGIVPACHAPREGIQGGPVGRPNRLRWGRVPQGLQLGTRITGASEPGRLRGGWCKPTCLDAVREARIKLAGWPRSWTVGGQGSTGPLGERRRRTPRLSRNTTGRGRRTTLWTR